MSAEPPDALSLPLEVRTVLAEVHQMAESERVRERNRKSLNERIAEYAAAGYRMVSRDDTTAQMVLPKQLSWVTLVLVLIVMPALSGLALVAFAPAGLLLGALSSLFFALALIEYLLRRDRLAWLYVDGAGNVQAVEK